MKRLSLQGGAPDSEPVVLPSQGVKSAVRVLMILELLTIDSQGKSFQDICIRLELPRSSTHALLRTLTDRGHLEFDPVNRVYRIGIRLWEAGQAYNRAFDLAAVAQPHLQAVRDILRETVQLATLSGSENIYIAKVDSDQRLTLQSHVGARLPAYATGLGKVLLAGLSDDDVTARFPTTELKAFTSRTITRRAALLAVLHQVRERDYATDYGEYTPGVTCVAVPVRDRSGYVVAAMSVSVPDVRMSPPEEERARTVLAAEAQRLSAALGYPAVHIK